MSLREYKRAFEMLETLDSVTYNHSNRVKSLMEYVLFQMGIYDEEMIIAAQFHDIGKLYIPTRILDKHAGLTELEREIIDRHAYYGYRIIRDLPFSRRTAEIVLFHHGYRSDDAIRLHITPDQKLLESALLLMTIDRFEALTTDRPYHRGESREAAAEIIQKDEHHKRGLQILMEKETD